jgi:hypothetical protein
MKNMKSILMLVVAAVLFASCATQAYTHKDFIPEDTIFYAQVNDPDEFLANLDDFLAESGLSELLFGQDIKDFLIAFFENALVDLSEMDFDRTIGLAFSGNLVYEDFDLYIIIPVVEDYKNIKRDLEFNLGPANIADFDNYLVLSMNPEELDSFPPKKTADISFLDEEYNEPGIELFLSWDTMLESLGTSVEEFIQEEGLVAEGAPEEATAVFESLNAFYSSIQLNKDGFYTEFDMEFEGPFLEELKAARSDPELIQKRFPVLSESFLFYVGVVDFSDLGASSLYANDGIMGISETTGIDMDVLVDIFSVLYDESIQDMVGEQLAFSLQFDAENINDFSASMLFALQSPDPETLQTELIDKISEAFKTFAEEYEAATGTAFDISMLPEEFEDGIRISLEGLSPLGFGNNTAGISLFSKITENFVTFEIGILTDTINQDIEFKVFSDLVPLSMKDTYTQEVAGLFAIDLLPLSEILNTTILDDQFFISNPTQTVLTGFIGVGNRSVKIGMHAESGLFLNLLPLLMLNNDF